LRLRAGCRKCFARVSRDAFWTRSLGHHGLPRRIRSSPFRISARSIRRSHQPAPRAPNRPDLPGLSTRAISRRGECPRPTHSSSHRRILTLIGIGMFFDGFDVYVAATVLGATLKTGFSTLNQNALFVSVTFLGMMLGSFFTGFLGDRYGRRFTYQANLVIFGLASVAAAFAPSMLILIVLRRIMGLGLGA